MTPDDPGLPRMTQDNPGVPLITPELLCEFAQDKVISEYVRCFSKRCIDLEAEAARAASV